VSIIFSSLTFSIWFWPSYESDVPSSLDESQAVVGSSIGSASARILEQSVWHVEEFISHTSRFSCYLCRGKDSYRWFQVYWNDCTTASLICIWRNYSNSCLWSIMQLYWWIQLVPFRPKNFFWWFVLISAVKTNDMMLVIYLSSLIRSVIALHNLINNKVCVPLTSLWGAQCPMRCRFFGLMY